MPSLANKSFSDDDDVAVESLSDDDGNSESIDEESKAISAMTSLLLDEISLSVKSVVKNAFVPSELP